MAPSVRNIQVLVLCGIILATVQAAVTPDPCTSYKVKDEPLRSTGYNVKDKNYEHLICDLTLQDGWYKFANGNQMPESCVPQYHCGTHVPIWLNAALNGGHPSVADGIVTRQVCAHDDQGCCGYQANIRVKNCQTFYVYELTATPGCSMAYCAGSGTPCPADKWSPSGFEPGCVSAYPKLLQTPQLSNPIVKPETFEFNCHIPFDAKRTDVGFEVTWLFDGHSDPKIPKTQVVGATRDATLDQKYLEGHLGHDLTCAVSAYFKNSPGRHGPKIPSAPYWVGIKMSEARLTVGENEKEKEVKLISTIPIVCKKAAQQSCQLEIYLDPNNHDIKSAKGCSVTLHPGDWNPTTNMAVTSFQVLAERDFKKDGNQLLDLHFNPLYSVDAPPTFNHYQIPYLQIETKDKPTSTCICTGDPHCTTLDRQNAHPRQSHYNYYKVGEFVLYKSSSRHFEVQTRTWTCGKVSCMCAVSAREGNDVINVDMCHGHYGHTFPKVTIQHQGQVSQGTVVQKDKAGNNFVIYFPSGAWVKIHNRRGTVLDVTIQAPPDDIDHTHGLCGTFDGRTDNDQTSYSGHVERWSSKPDKFVESWRIPIGTSNFDNTVPIDPKDNNNISYCNCDSAKKLVDCRIDAKAARPAVHTRCPTCQNIPLGNGNAGRRRRQTTLQNDDDIDYQHFEYGYGWNPTIPDFPTPSGKTMSDAEKLCKDGFQKMAVIRECSAQVGMDFSGDIESCVEDIKITDDDTFVASALEGAVMSCMEKVLKEPSFYDNTTGLPPAFITTDLCPSHCSSHGDCNQGVCTCDAGFVGDACQYDSTKPPAVSGILSTDPYSPDSDYCDITIKPCETIYVIGDNIRPEPTAKCRLREIMLQGTGFTLSEHYTTGTLEYESMYHAGCHIPSIAERKGRTVIGYQISLTNDGKLYSNTTDVYIVDATCMDCFDSGKQCTIKDDTCLIDGNCRVKGETNPANSKQSCDPSSSNINWSGAEIRTTVKPTTSESHVTTKHVTTKHVTAYTTGTPTKQTARPSDGYFIAPVDSTKPTAAMGGATNYARFDIWTLSKTGCTCPFNKSRDDCACCDTGACQCSSSHANQCVQCGHNDKCSNPLPAPDNGVDGYTLVFNDCTCDYDNSLFNCACCHNNGSQCGQANKNQCVDSHHMYTCGMKPWLFGPDFIVN